MPDVTVICSVHHPKLPELHPILDRMGCTVYEGINPKNHGPNPVRYEIIRRFSKKDILAAEYLYVDQLGYGADCMIPPAECMATTDEGRIPSLKQSWKTKFVFYQFGDRGAVNDEGRRLLEEAGIKGAIFKEVLWNNPGKAKGRFFYVGCHKTMPPCLLPIVEDKYGYHSYHDGPYKPPILRYNRAAVAAMGEWDISLVAEVMGRPPDPTAARGYVISGRFRDVLLANKIHLNARPVVLEDE